MISFLLLMLVAILFGYTEHIVMAGGFISPEPRFFKNKISFKYHLPMWAIWGITCFLSGHLWAVGAFAVVQDSSWYVFNKNESIQEDSWAAMGLGGFTIPLINQFVPWTYILLLSCSVALLIM